MICLKTLRFLPVAKVLAGAQPCPVQICVDVVRSCIFCGVIATLSSEIWDTQAC